MSNEKQEDKGYRLGVTVILGIVALAGITGYYQFVYYPDYIGGIQEYEVEVTARQWTFEGAFAFEGPDGSNVITVPKGARIIMRITSAMDRLPVNPTTNSTFDAHGLFIEGYGVSAVLPVGETVTVEFDADQAGEFGMRCTVFCGFIIEDGEYIGHDTMTGTLRVVEDLEQEPSSSA